MSSSFANFAAVLCGLTLGAIAFLLGRKEATPPHTLALLYSGVFILALDAFLFALLSARRPPVKGDVVTPGSEYVCYHMWIRAMPTIGMLMIGSLVLVSGVGWMLTQHAKDNDIDSKIFASLGGIFTIFLILAIPAFLGAISVEYIDLVDFPAQPPLLAKVAIWTFVGIMALTSCALILMRTVGLYRYRKYNSDWGDMLEPRFRALATASISIGAYGFVSGILNGVAVVWIRSSDAARSGGVVWFAIALALISPFVISLAIAYAVPGPKLQDAWKRYDTKTSA